MTARKEGGESRGFDFLRPNHKISNAEALCEPIFCYEIVNERQRDKRDLYNSKYLEIQMFEILDKL